MSANQNQDKTHSDFIAWNASAVLAHRQDFLAQHPCAPLSALACGEAAAQAWLSEGKIFTIPTDQGPVAPLFQLHDGAPHPVVAAALKILQPKITGWGLAFWFAHPKGWTPQEAAPLALLESNGAAVLDAARREVEDIFY